MYLNSWENVTLICGNHKDDETIEMQIKEVKGGRFDTAFYSCPEYRSIYGKDHEKRSCNNRLTVTDFEKMLNYIMTESDDGVNTINLTGHKWTMNGIDFEVIEQEGIRFKVKMLNKKAIAK